MPKALPIRHEWSRPLKGFRVERLYGGEYLVPRLGAEREPDAAALAALPQRLVTLEWPISTDTLRELANDVGAFLDAGMDAEAVGVPFAAQADTLRLAILELQVAVKLRDALERRLPLDRWLDRGPGGGWRLRVEPPEGLERFDPRGRLDPPVFRRDGRRFVLPTTVEAAGRGALRAPARALLADLFGAAFTRWVRLDPGGGEGKLAVAIRSPLGAAWWELAHAPPLVTCFRCERPFPRNRRLKRGTDFCSPRCQVYVSRKRARVRALRADGLGPKRIARALDIPERLARRIIQREERA